MQESKNKTGKHLIFPADLKIYENTLQVGVL